MRSWAVLALLLASSTARGAQHRLELKVEGATVQGSWALPVVALEQAMGLDQDMDGVVTDEELLARQRAVADLAMAHLEVRADGAGCPATPEKLLPADGLALLRFRVTCPQVPKDLEVRNELWLDLLPGHRSELLVVDAGARHVHVFTQARRRARFQLGAWPGLAALRGYLKLGARGALHPALLVLAILLGAAVSAATRSGQALALAVVAAVGAGAFTVSRLGIESRPEELLLGALLVLAARLLHARRDPAFELGAVLVGGMALGAQGAAALARVGLPPAHQAVAALGYVLGVAGPPVVLGSLGAALGRDLEKSPLRGSLLAVAGVLAALGLFLV